MINASLLVVLALFVGSFPSGVVLSRLFVGRDVRDTGSGNIGAANAVRAGGMKLGLAVGALDIFKGTAPVLLGRGAGLDAVGLALVALAAVLGHDFSIFLRFRGGKGVATTLGAALALAPLPTVLAMISWVVLLLISGYSSLASLAALAALPLFFGFMGEPSVSVMAAVLLLLIAAAKHAGNITRLMDGTESSFRDPRPRGG